MNGIWRDDYRSWGNIVSGRHLVTTPNGIDAARREAAEPGALPVLAYGSGRSYGDSPLNPDGRLVDCRGLDRFIDFDPQTGVLRCEAGVRLADILTVICRPAPDGGGWFLPVTPGTRFVTVGGAIANDVHGKNHHRFGTFGRHVLAFELARSDGAVRSCSQTENAALFAATIGGLGLTGVILRATVQLRRVPGLGCELEDIPFGNLADFFTLAAESDMAWEYTAAWVDCLARGRGLGRGVFSRARHAGGYSVPPPASTSRLSVPVELPISLATPLTVRAFNIVHWRKAGLRPRGVRRGSYEKLLYPLDALGNWNRIYGRSGFFQFQCVVPMSAGRDTIGELLHEIARAGQGSMLSVLKTFGDLDSPGMMSFPMPGVTLALDFPNRGSATRQLLARLEQIVVAAGGRLYPAKDGTMTAETFRRGYPALDRFAAHIDPKFASAFARRVGLVGGVRPEAC